MELILNSGFLNIETVLLKLPIFKFTAAQVYFKKNKSKNMKLKLWTENQLKLLWASSLFVVLVSHPAFTMGDIKLEGMSFMRTSGYRETSSGFLALGPVIEDENNYISAHSDLHFYVFLADPRQVGFQLKDLYIATSPKLSSLFELQAGIHHHQWSEFDETLDFGLWNPRFMWNPLRPEKAGLMGVFPEYHSKWVQCTGYATWISIPEIGKIQSLSEVTAF